MYIPNRCLLSIYTSVTINEFKVNNESDLIKLLQHVSVKRTYLSKYQTGSFIVRKPLFSN